MILACAIDRRYTELAGVMLYSCNINGNIPDVEFYVLADGLREIDKQNIRACAGRPVVFIDMTDEMISTISGFRTTSNWSRATYARLILPNILEARHERVVYLDADIIVKKDLSYLFKVDLGDSYLAAVSAPNAFMNRGLQRPEDMHYFSAGVLVVDIQRWKDNNFTQKSLDLLSSNKFPFLDQDALNVMIGDRFLRLEEKWNAQLLPDYSDVAVVHFIRDKPNTIACDHPEKSVFLSYRAHTPWANKPLLPKREKRWRRLKHSIMRRLKNARSLLSSKGD